MSFFEQVQHESRRFEEQRKELMKTLTTASKQLFSETGKSGK